MRGAGAHFLPLLNIHPAPLLKYQNTRFAADFQNVLCNAIPSTVVLGDTPLVCVCVCVLCVCVLYTESEYRGGLYCIRDSAGSPSLSGSTADGD